MTATKPALSDEAIVELVHKLYGLKVLSVVKFDGYDDLNLHVKVEFGFSENDHITVPAKDGYVLKISNVRYDYRSIAAQNSVMLFLHDNLTGVKVPFPVRSRSGNHWDYACLPKIGRSNGETEVSTKHIVRLLEFTPGKILSTVSSEPGKHVLEQVGELVGRFIKVMKDFNSKDLSENPLDIWALENISQLRDRLDAVEDVEKLAVFRDVISEFDSYLNHHRHTLDEGILHGDINEGNIIVAKAADNAGAKFHIEGIIDFSDTHSSCRIFDLVLAITYMVLESYNKRLLDPVEAGAHVLAGYMREVAITPAELGILKVGIEARITQSLVLGMHTFKHHEPGNLYLLRTQASGWHVLQLLRQMTTQELFDKWTTVVPTLFSTEVRP